jgi:hypothetical protein
MKQKLSYTQLVFPNPNPNTPNFVPFMPATLNPQTLINLYPHTVETLSTIEFLRLIELHMIFTLLCLRVFHREPVRVIMDPGT